MSCTPGRDPSVRKKPAEKKWQCASAIMGVRKDTGFLQKPGLF
jgi:hypothetical protein